MLMVWYMNAYDYPIVIGGKPMFSPFYPFVPCFELTILLGAFGAVLGMLFLNRLPRLYHPLLKNRRFAQVTHDKFFIVIECDDPMYSEQKPASCWKPPAAGTSSWWRNNALLPCHLCPLRARNRGSPGLSWQSFPQTAAIHLPGHGAAAQTAAPNGQMPFFGDGMSSRLPVAGAIARSQPIQVGDKLIYSWQDTPVTTGRVAGTTNLVELNPLPVTAELMQRGEQVFNINCAACHSRLGDGNGNTKRIGAMVVVGNLHDKRIVELTDGELFNTISYGKNLMLGYAGTIPIQDRWAPSRICGRYS